MKRIYEVLEGVYSNESLRRTVVPLFVGNPGIGKTVIIEEWKNFDDITIKKMNGRAKEFWSLWKEVLFRVIDTKRKEEEAL